MSNAHKHRTMKVIKINNYIEQVRAYDNMIISEDEKYYLEVAKTKLLNAIAVFIRESNNSSF